MNIYITKYILQYILQKCLQKLFKNNSHKAFNNNVLNINTI